MWDPLYKFDPMKTWLSGYMAWSSKKSYRVAVQVSELVHVTIVFHVGFHLFSLQIYIFRYTLGMVFIIFLYFLSFIFGVVLIGTIK